MSASRSEGRPAYDGEQRHGRQGMIDPCEVYWADPVMADSARQRLLRLLSDDERRRWAESRCAEDRARYLAAHALARIVLAERVGTAPESLQFTNECERCGRPHGRPRLLGANPPVHISLAHSGRRVALAVASRSPVGIDVEQVTLKRDVLPLIHEALSMREREAFALVASAGRTRVFLRYWTRKEAILKATGHGLAIAPKLVTVSAHDAPAALLAWDAEDRPDLGVSLRDLRVRPGPRGMCCGAGRDWMRGDTRRARTSRIGVTEAGTNGRCRGAERANARTLRIRSRAWPNSPSSRRCRRRVPRAHGRGRRCRVPW